MLHDLIMQERYCLRNVMVQLEHKNVEILVLFKLFSLFSLGCDYKRWIARWVFNYIFILLFNSVQPSLSAWSRGVHAVLQSPRSHRGTSVSWSSSTRPTVLSKSCEYQVQCLSHTSRCSTASWGGLLWNPPTHHFTPSISSCWRSSEWRRNRLPLSSIMLWVMLSQLHISRGNATGGGGLLDFDVVLLHKGRCHRVPLEGFSHPLCLNILLTCHILACWWEFSVIVYVSV